MMEDLLEKLGRYVRSYHYMEHSDMERSLETAQIIIDEVIKPIGQQMKRDIIAKINEDLASAKVQLGNNYKLIDEKGNEVNPDKIASNLTIAEQIEEARRSEWKEILSYIEAYFHVERMKLEGKEATLLKPNFAPPIMEKVNAVG